MLELQRSHFDDATYAFEAHHMNQRSVRNMLARYYVGPAPEGGPALSDPDSFYGEFRRRVHKYLKAHGGSGPTRLGLTVWWIIVVGWLVSHAFALMSGSLWAVLPISFVSGLLGGYGHNWIHLPRYRHFAYCLDVIGLSSRQWQTTHVLKHHMFTNTPRDNHWSGTDPFLPVDPCRDRAWWQRWLVPLMQPIVLFFGVFGNYLTQVKSMILHAQARRNQWSWAKLILPLEFLIYMLVLGPGRGALMLVLATGIASFWYFMVALGNHNTDAAWNLQARLGAQDWREAQLQVSSDVGTQLGYIASAQFVWLNYHTVHHLVPAVDQSHHPQIQRILVEVCDEYGIAYSTCTYWQMLRGMVKTFSTRRWPDVKLDWSTLWSETHTTPALERTDEAAVPEEVAAAGT